MKIKQQVQHSAWKLRDTWNRDYYYCFFSLWSLELYNIRKLSQVSLPLKNFPLQYLWECPSHELKLPFIVSVKTVFFFVFTSEWKESYSGQWWNIVRVNRLHMSLHAQFLESLILHSDTWSWKREPI